MDKNKKIIIGIIAIIVLIILLIILLPKEESGNYYSNNVSDWMWEEENGTIHISTDKTTKGHGFESSRVIELYYSNFSTAFKLDGAYNGYYFKSYNNPYSDKIKITNNMDPTNDIIECYIVPEINKTVRYHIYVDQDWKRKITPTNIFWGPEFENSKPFEFKEIKEGIYYDIIDDSIENYDHGFRIKYSALIVGNIQNIDNDNISSKTFIKIS